MNIDVKKLLYKYKQFLEAKRNAELSIKALRERYTRYRADVNWFIRGTGAGISPTEAQVINEEDTVRKIDHLEYLIMELTNVVEAIGRARDTLGAEQRELINLRYIEDNSIVYVCEKMHIKENKYFHLHKLAVESMNICLSTFYWDGDPMDWLTLSPAQIRYETTVNPKYFQSNRVVKTSLDKVI